MRRWFLRWLGVEQELAGLEQRLRQQKVQLILENAGRKETEAIKALQSQVVALTLAQSAPPPNVPRGTKPEIYRASTAAEFRDILEREAEADMAKEYPN